jgi:hypothetical protein
MLTDPFLNRAPSLTGPATDILPVTPSDSGTLAHVALALYVETPGSVRFITVANQIRTVALAANMILPVGVRQVLATGTTATGIHALVLA